VLIAIFTPHSNNEKTTSSSSSSDNKTETVKKNKVPGQYKAALGSAETYANTMHMSKQAIFEQLQSSNGDKFPQDAAQYAIDNVKADWNKNALESAKTYQSDMNMSTDQIKEQLISSNGDKFTEEQAEYAVQHLED